jgi:hypothetical protein
MVALMIFEPFPKLARLSRECVITEKIDGTNAQIIILSRSEVTVTIPPAIALTDELVMYAGSRTRLIVPGDDNFGFARWVADHSEELFQLGEGRHFGEWWGSGIQRGYGLPKGEKRFSLFNTARWGADRDLVKYPAPPPSCCHVVPVLDTGVFTTELVSTMVERLRTFGSLAAPGFMNPEGVVVFHSASGQLFKKTLEKDEAPKSAWKEVA